MGLKISQIATFIKKGIWRVRLEDYPPYKSFLLSKLRVFLLSARGFNEDKCLLRASALTYYTLISIVPVIAMLFGIAKGFGFDQMLETQLTQKMAGHEEILQQVLSFSRSMLENTKGGVIAGFGIAVLFWSVMKVLGNIEEAFNDIWEIKKPRSWARKFSDYLSIMLVAPVLVILSGSVNVFIKTEVTQLAGAIGAMEYFGFAVYLLLKLLPFTLIWLLFTFIFMVIPNTKVNFRSALFAAVIGGTIFQLAQWVYITFQYSVGSYNAIYGSFAALPLFLFWLHTSWMIVLFGAEISFASQNEHLYEFETESHGISYSFKRLLSLLAAHQIVIRFAKGESPPTASELSDELKIPIRIIHSILSELSGSGIVSEIKTDGNQGACYQPALNIDHLNIQYVMEKLDNLGTEDIPVAETDEMKNLKDALNSFKKVIQDSGSNKLLKEL